MSYNHHFQQLLADDRNRRPNCKSVSPTTVKDGIMVALNGEGFYVPVGDNRLPTDNKLAPFFHKRKDGTAIVVRATHHWVEPRNGNRPFEVLRSVRDEPDSALIRISTKPVSTLKDETIRPYHGVSGTCEIVRSSGDEWLIVLRPGDYAYAFWRDGSVSKLTLAGSVYDLDVRRLDVVEATRARLELAEKHLAEPWARSQEVREDILYAVISIMPLTRGHVEALDMFVEFLKRDDLSDGMRIKIRSHLESFGDERANSGWWNAQRPFKGVQSKSPKGPPPEKQAKAKARSDADAARRSEMRGTSGGGGNNNRSNKSGGKKNKKKK